MPNAKSPDQKMLIAAVVIAFVIVWWLLGIYIKSLLFPQPNAENVESMEKARFEIIETFRPFPDNSATSGKVLRDKVTNLCYLQITEQPHGYAMVETDC